jgi:hypothetical protein
MWLLHILILSALSKDNVYLLNEQNQFISKRSCQYIDKAITMV